MGGGMGDKGAQGLQPLRRRRGCRRRWRCLLEGLVPGNHQAEAGLKPLCRKRDWLSEEWIFSSSYLCLSCLLIHNFLKGAEADHY